VKWLVLPALLLALAACGGAKKLEGRVVQAAPPPAEVTGPKASPEEVAGEVPALRGPLDAMPLVPPELVPPEPPADPEPTFE
jgi:hypothetical protein